VFLGLGRMLVVLGMEGDGPTEIPDDNR